MPKGTVKWLSARRGCAFTVPDGGDVDTFVHITSVEHTGFGTLNEGRRGEYDVNRARERCFSAANLRPADGAGASVLSHVSGERGGPPVGAFGLPDQPQSAGE